ncbi:F-box/kelch-repeat protein At3g23880-like [Cornus florida]|uniref:F-box/kelch-repeat protein At3g23880-like n=1 Tax=Cornus florida TaxID=4283 RepID=UPI00289BF00E|nr:F-box/kelch-repeat protein At3g23880-like [Cornus florida]
MGRKRNQRKPAIEGDASNLPCEIICTILSKLPVKSLLQFKCVCKSWRAAISKPQFVKLHLNESIKLNRQKLFCSEMLSDPFYSIGYESFDISVEKLSFPCKKYRKAGVVCTCNGLVLLGLDHDKMSVLWNPSIRDYKKFSCPPHIYDKYKPKGLCYDSSMDDYKVEIPLLGFSRCYDQCEWCVTLDCFYTKKCPGEANLSSDSSSSSSSDGDDNGNYPAFIHQSQDFRMDTVRTPYTLPPYSRSSLYNSNTHVFEYAYDFTKTYVIVYYDMVDERFKEMPPPKCIKEGDIFSLTVMRGCLSLFCNSIDKKHVVVWTMKQYGENNSWTKFIVIPRWVETTRHLDYLTPLCAMKKGEVVMMINLDSLVIYNPKEN